MIELETVHRTARIAVEPLVTAHATELFEPLSDPRLYRYIPDTPPASLAALGARYTRLATRRSPDGAELWLNWVMRALAAGAPTPLGLLQATVSATRADVAYTVFTLHQRRGFATEGTRWMLGWLHAHLGVSLARATVDTRNTPSVALLRRLGFTLVDTIRSPDLIGGIHANDHVFELDLALAPDALPCLACSSWRAR